MVHLNNDLARKKIDNIFVRSFHLVALAFRTILNHNFISNGWFVEKTLIKSVEFSCVPEDDYVCHFWKVFGNVSKLIVEVFFCCLILARTLLKLDGSQFFSIQLKFCNREAREGPH